VKHLRTLSAVCIGLFLFFNAASAHAQWVDKLTLYVPNRVLDLMDAFTLNIGLGPTAHAELRATRAVQIGGGVSWTFRGEKDFNRQYGFALQNGAFGYLSPLVYEDLDRRPAYLLAKDFWLKTDGILDPKDPVYDPHTGAIDFWEIGGSLGAAVIEADVSIHPIEIADALLGFFFIDLRGDDLTFESFTTSKSK